MDMLPQLVDPQGLGGCYIPEPIRDLYDCPLRARAELDTVAAQVAAIIVETFFLASD